jgi:prepilin-type N-terminal cleavage/methylation domain-containing protein
MKKGFTLIELLVVIAIIAVLSTLSVVSLSSARQKSRDTRRVSDIRQIQTALEMYALNRTDGLYPVTSSANIKGFCLDDTGLVPICVGAVFMKKIPSNPSPNGTDYIYSSDGMSYTLTYQLENKTGSFPAGAATATPGGMQ